MASLIINAIKQGFNSKQILQHIGKKYPHYANAINISQAAGFTPEKILKYLNEGNAENSDGYLTSHERLRKADKRTQRNKGLAVLGTLGTVAAAGTTAYGLANANKAINPTSILPALPQRRPSLQQRQLPQAQPRQNLPYRPGGPGPTPKQPPSGPGPQQPPQTPMNRPPSPIIPPNIITLPQSSTQNQPAIIPPNPERSTKLIKTLGIGDRVEKVLKGGLGVTTAAQILRTMIPKNKLALLDKEEGGLEQIIKDYHQGMLETTRQGTLGKFNDKIKNKSLIDQELERLNKHHAEKNQELLPEKIVQSDASEIIPEAILPKEKLEKNESPLNERISEIAYGEEKPKKLAESKELKSQRFSIPNYRYANEPISEYNNRKILYNAIDKGSKAILAGKSFLDFPVNSEGIKARGGYSTAKDVLQFLTGLPSIYDPLLDEEERDELTIALMDTGAMTNPELAATAGKQNIHGANITPNLVWNLLLSVEPRLATMEKPPSVKGYKMAPGKKMGTSELRRFLTNSVYGVLSGRNISYELSDKINKISQAAASVDKIAKSAQDSNTRHMQEELDHIFKNDPQLLSMMYEEAEELYRKASITPELQEREEYKKTEDLKYIAAKKRAEKKKVGLNED